MLFYVVESMVLFLGTECLVMYAWYRYMVMLHGIVTWYGEYVRHVRRVMQHWQPGRQEAECTHTYPRVCGV